VNAHTQLVFALGLAALCSICALIFLVWLVCSLGKDLYRHRHTFFVKNTELNAHRITPRFHVGRDVK